VTTRCSSGSTRCASMVTATSRRTASATGIASIQASASSTTRMTSRWRRSDRSHFHVICERAKNANATIVIYLFGAFEPDECGLIAILRAADQGAIGEANRLNGCYVFPRSAVRGVSPAAHDCHVGLQTLSSSTFIATQMMEEMWL